MRARWMLAVVVAAGLGPGLAPAHASSSRIWTISAAHSASTTVHLTRSVLLQMEDQAGESTVNPKVGRAFITSKGSYGGLLIRDAHHEVRAAVVHYGFTPFFITWGQYDNSFRQILEPGTYQVTVLGDAATTVHLRVVGATPARTRATSNVTVRSLVSRSQGSGPQSAVAQFRTPLVVHSTTTFMTMGYAHGKSSGLDASDLCVADPETSTCHDAPVEMISSGGGVGSERWDAGCIFGYPGGFPVPTGTYESRLTQGSAGLSDDHALVTLAVD